VLDGAGELLLGFRQDPLRFGDCSLGQPGLFPGAAGGFPRFFASALGYPRLLLGRLPLLFGFRELEACDLDFIEQLVRAAGAFWCFH